MNLRESAGSRVGATLCHTNWLDSVERVAGDSLSDTCWSGVGDQVWRQAWARLGGLVRSWQHEVCHEFD